MIPDIEVYSPFSGDVIGHVKNFSSEEVKREIDIAASARESFRKTPKAYRSSILERMSNSVQCEMEGYAQCIVSESGKTIRQARKEVQRCINTLKLSAEEAKRIHGNTIPFDAFTGSESRTGYYTRDPLGLIAGITPYNDPLNLVAHKLGPAIASGNCFVLKPSELTPFSAMRLCQAAWDSGMCKDALRVITGDATAGSALVSDSRIRMVSFTGGMATAEKIVRTAGVKKYLMDLGGNAPVIVCADADLEKASQACVSGAYWAAGQNCVSVQRILVHESIYAVFRDMLIEQIRSLRVGDPSDERTDVGPMISIQAAMRAEHLINLALNSGSKVLVGHRREGSLLYPTLVENTSRDALLWLEEVFAPVVNITAFANIDEAIQLANQSESSLHAGIFTNDLSLSHKLIDALEMGGVMVNDSSDYRIDAMPFGGFKMGSMGREGVKFAVEEMTQTKVVCMNF